jgi:hypothetical protein
MKTAGAWSRWTARPTALFPADGAAIIAAGEGRRPFTRATAAPHIMREPAAGAGWSIKSPRRART